MSNQDPLASRHDTFSEARDHATTRAAKSGRAIKIIREYASIRYLVTHLSYAPGEYPANIIASVSPQGVVFAGS